MGIQILRLCVSFYRFAPNLSQKPEERNVSSNVFTNNVGNLNFVVFHVLAVIIILVKLYVCVLVLFSKVGNIGIKAVIMKSEPL